MGRGQLVATVAEREEALGQRDALYLRADRPRAFRNPTRMPCVYYLIIHPASA